MYKVLGNFKYGGENYTPGQQLDIGDEAIEKELLDLGRIELVDGDAPAAPSEPEVPAVPEAPAAPEAPTPPAPEAPAAPSQPETPPAAPAPETPVAGQPTATDIENDPDLQ